MRDAAKTVDPTIVLSKVETMADHLGYIFFLPRMAALLLALVGGLALVLGAVGLYGMVSYAAARRTREMGIRLALGAERGRVVGMVVRGGLAVVGVGALLGLAGSVALGSALGSFLIGVGTMDPLALLAAPVILGAVARHGLLAAGPPRRPGGSDRGATVGVARSERAGESGYIPGAGDPDRGVVGRFPPVAEPAPCSTRPPRHRRPPDPSPAPSTSSRSRASPAT